MLLKNFTLLFVWAIECVILFPLTMVLVRFKSFILGIVLTSITWTVIIFLYSKVSPKNHNTLQKPVKWKLRARIPLVPQTMDDTNILSLKEEMLQKNNYADKKSLLPRELNLINNREIYDLQMSNNVGSLLSQILKTSHNSMDLLHLGMIHSPEDQRIKDEGYKRHAFNMLISDRIGFRRSLPNTAHALCRHQKYSADLPAASIIICFYNEAWSTLLRMIYSILDRTPQHLLHEILLIDDFSDNEEFKEHLKLYVSQNLHNSKVKFLRTPKRAGLIRARVFGAHHATGEVLVFLDSHCEVNQNWLEPLLDRIHENKTNVVCPIIDIINADTFEYISSPIVRGGFNWGLHFKWDSVLPTLLQTKNDFVKPIMSPTMAGGLFAIDKKYFEYLGEYDQGMDVWGGENLEISFRIWMCGGHLEIIPCSRVGHVFRKRRPYGSPDGEDTLTHNSLRVAHVWMDDYREYYFKIRPDAHNKQDGDISDRLELRNRLHCKSFDWYMKNVYPELSPPQDANNIEKKVNSIQSEKKIFATKLSPPVVIYKFQIQLADSDLCIESEDDVATKGSLLLLRKCALIKRQIWYKTAKHDFRLAHLLCLDSGEKYPRLSKCHEMGGSQDWRHGTMLNCPIYNAAAGLCLGSKSETVGEYVTLAMCSRLEARKWNLLTQNVL